MKTKSTIILTALILFIGFAVDSAPMANAGARAETFKLGGGVTLELALELALAKNPDLSAAAMEIKATEAQKTQAGLWPNPEFSVEAENFGGTKELRGSEGMETTVQLSQLIELGGKRSKRVKTADINVRLASLDYEIERLDLIERTSEAFIDFLAAQERASLGKETLALAERTRDIVVEQATAGKASPIESVKARIAFSDAMIRLQKLKKDLKVAGRFLASHWGGKSPLFEKALGRLDDALSKPEKTGPESAEGNPELMRWSLEVEKREAELELAKSEAMPDITINGGVRRLNEVGDDAFMFGVSAPLKVFNRNQGNILEAELRLEKIKKKKEAAEARIYASMSEAGQTLAVSFSEAELWKRSILPDARAALSAAQNAYRHGKFTLLELMDAQMTFFKAENARVESLVEYRKSLVRLERLTGEHLYKNRKHSVLEDNHEE